MERCEKIIDVVQENTFCYHCNRRIWKGQKAAFLFSLDGDEYTLCQECAKKAVLRHKKRLALPVPSEQGSSGKSF